MRKYIYMTAVILTAFLSLTLNRSCKQIEKYRELYNRELNNVRAYESLNTELERKNIEFSFTMDELRASRDSLNVRLMETVDKLKIKDKNVKYLQYQESVIGKSDTVVFRDTVFRENIHVDTVIGDRWYDMRLKLDYPSTIMTYPVFRSEKTVVVNTRKEYNSKPSKIFFIRWFQKKHTVTEVDIIENNPYIEDTQNRFIKITK